MPGGRRRGPAAPGRGVEALFVGVPRVEEVVAVEREHEVEILSEDAGTLRETVSAVARWVGVKPEDVVIISEYTGGGFGSKFGPDIQGIVAAHLATADSIERYLLDSIDKAAIRRIKASAI